MDSCCRVPPALCWVLGLFLAAGLRPVEAACVEVNAVEQVVVNKTAKLSCISCRKRQDQDAFVDVTWTFQPKDNITSKIDILKIIRSGETTEFLSEQFGSDRMWLSNSKDYQEVSLLISETIASDSGIYNCAMNVILDIPNLQYPPEFQKFKTIHLEVLTELPEDITKKVSEVMMYFMIVASTVALLVALIVCYQRVRQADKNKFKKATELLVIGPVIKETCAGQQAEEEAKSSS